MNSFGLKLPEAGTGTQGSLIENVKGLLKKIEASCPRPSSIDLVLDGLADQLVSMRAKGFTLDYLASVLTRSGIAISDSELDAYLRKALLSRMSACEAKVEEIGRRGHVGPSQRSAFIQRGLRRALDVGEGLVLHYQPQVDMLTGSVIGAEALLRWNHGSELVSSMEFIPVAEEFGLIEEIGTWVMREACVEAARWRKLGLGQGQGIRVSVNLSVKQFSDRLPGVIHSALCDTGLRTEMLGVEITESFLAEDRSQGLLQLLHDTGIHLSIDDFGTGYSCLSRVCALPLDTIKIDRAFVADLGRSNGAAAVVQTIISMAEKLSMSTIAEGVETQHQADLLKELGCTVVQGFLYAKPMPASDFIKFASAAP